MAPIKRNKHIVTLSKDHHLTLLFCWKIRQGLKYDVSGNRIVSYVKYFWVDHMLPHFYNEEKILFPNADKETVKKALADHKEIALLINNLIASSENQKDLLNLTADKVDDHVRYEERILFPALENIISNEKLESIGIQLEENKSEDSIDNFPDQFWLKEK